MQDEREVELAGRSCLRRSGHWRLEQVGDADGGDLLEEASTGRACD